MGKNLARLLKSYWKYQMIVPKTGKFLGKKFRTGGKGHFGGCGGVDGS